MTEQLTANKTKKGEAECSTSRSRRTQAERRFSTRQALLEAAITLLLDNGYDGCTVAAVADQAGLTSGSVQHHFKTKADLMLAIIREGIFDLSKVDLQDHHSNLTVSQRCERLIATQWEYYGNPKYVAIWSIILGSRSDTDSAARISEWQKEAIGHHEFAIGHLFADLNLTPQKVKSLQYLTNAQLRGLALLQAVEPDEEVVARQLKLFTSIVENFLNG